MQNQNDKLIELEPWLNSQVLDLNVAFFKLPTMSLKIGPITQVISSRGYQDFILHNKELKFYRRFGIVLDGPFVIKHSGNVLFSTDDEFADHEWSTIGGRDEQNKVIIDAILGQSIVEIYSENGAVHLCLSNENEIVVYPLDGKHSRLVPLHNYLETEVTEDPGHFIDFLDYEKMEAYRIRNLEIQKRQFPDGTVEYLKVIR